MGAKGERHVDAGVVFVFLILLVVGVAALVLYFQVQTDEISSRVENNEDLGFLFVITEDGQPVLTQAFLYAPATGRGSLIDIPGDTGTIVSGLDRVDRIDSAFTEGGANAYRSQVASMLGTELPYYFFLDGDGLERLVDLAEGLPLFIAAGISDYTLDVSGLFPSGNVVLDGRKARDYLEFAELGERDVERVARRQSFVGRAISMIGSLANVIDDDEVARVFIGAVQTNLDQRSVRSLVRVLAEFEPERIVTRRVQGTVRSVEANGVEQELLFPHFEGQWLRETVRQVRESLSSEQQLPGEGVVISLEILNGTGATGLARRTQELFESHGFDVRSIGNAETSDVESTLVISRGTERMYAERTAEVIRAERVLTQEREGDGPIVDVTVIIGKDFDGRYVR
ncbi:MAG: LytR family transcriptional regulator [Spirochaetaceae bacterium]|nr:MAG: LytR family transcriptional regulator [Spirochaetaceae bacterium]